MADSDVNPSAETILHGERMPHHADDLPAIIRQIRLCRSTLGAILDELECRDGHGNATERIAECTTGVTAEIESLWEAAKRVD